MTLYPLIDKWWKSPHLELRHLARNFMLDVAVATSKMPHPDAATHGNRLQAADFVVLPKEVSDILAAGNSGDVEGMLRRIGTAWRRKNKARLLLGRSGHGAGSHQVQVAHYLSMRDAVRIWYDMQVPDPGKVLAAVRKKVPNQTVDFFSTLLKSGPMQTSPVYWVTNRDSSGLFPHEDPAVKAMEPPEKAFELARRLALPRYEIPKKRRSAVGLMVLMYTISSDKLMVPDILDAEGGWYFFPGPMNAAYGQTAPVSDTWQVPWQRSQCDHSGYVEYVHESKELRSIKPVLEEIGPFREAFS